MNEPSKNDMNSASRQSESGHTEHLSSSNGQSSDSNPLNRAIVESINYPLIVLDSSLRVIRHNRRFLEVFNVASRELENVSLSEVLADDRLESIIKQSIDLDEPSEEVEFSWLDGSDERHFLISTSGIELPSSEKGVVVTFNEVTEWKRHQGQVMEASRLVSIGEMAAGIAHEVNNPLAAVMGFTQLAMRRNQDSGITRDLEKILAETKRASKIITNLQSFARRYEPHKVDVDILSVVRKVLEFRSYELDVNNVTVDAKLGAEMPYVLGDEHQLEQVILNIVINAEFFMFEAHGGGTLTIEAVHEGNNVWLSFADDGPGIDSENLPKIFDPFFTTKEVGKGTGLGLSICYGIVHEHNGIITVDSVVGKGTTFTIELPVSSHTELKAPSYDATQNVSGIGNCMNILIVDDEPGVAEIVSRALMEQGHTVHVAESGSDVIRRGNLNQYDLFILDVKMPGIGGAALYNHIDSVSKDLSSRVMFITGDTTNPGIKELVNRTSSPLLTKPFTIENLISTVNRFMLTKSPAFSEESL